MIVVEERINEVLSQLPVVGGNKPVYAWGDEIHLNKWIIAMNKANKNTYPLIYQTSKKETQNIYQENAVTEWECILAMNNESVDLFNTERWALAFRNVLNPLADMITTGLLSADFEIEEGSIDIERYGNYGDENEHWSIDIWDAITYKCKLTIHNRKICTQKLNFIN